MCGVHGMTLEGIVNTFHQFALSPRQGAKRRDLNRLQRSYVDFSETVYSLRHDQLLMNLRFPR